MIKLTFCGYDIHDRARIFWEITEETSENFSETRQICQKSLHAIFKHIHNLEIDPTLQFFFVPQAPAELVKFFQNAENQKKFLTAGVSADNYASLSSAITAVAKPKATQRTNLTFLAGEVKTATPSLESKGDSKVSAAPVQKRVNSAAGRKLYQAVQTNDLSALVDHLKHKIPPSSKFYSSDCLTRDNSNWQPLTFALAHGKDFTSAKILLAKDPDIDKQVPLYDLREKILFSRFSFSDKKLAINEVDRKFFKNKTQNTPVEKTIAFFNTPHLFTLADQITRVYAALEEMHPDAIHTLMHGDPTNQVPPFLHYICAVGGLHAVELSEYCIDRYNADPNQAMGDGALSRNHTTTATPIEVAAAHGHLDLVDYFIRRESSKKQTATKATETKNETKDTHAKKSTSQESIEQAFIAAAKHGRISILRHLQENQVIKQQKTLYAAFLTALAQGEIETVRYLDPKGSSILQTKDESFEALQIAARAGQLNSIKYLDEKYNNKIKLPWFDGQSPEKILALLQFSTCNSDVLAYVFQRCPTRLSQQELNAIMEYACNTVRTTDCSTYLFLLEQGACISLELIKWITIAANQADEKAQQCLLFIQSNSVKQPEDLKTKKTAGAASSEADWLDVTTGKVPDQGASDQKSSVVCSIM